MTAPLIHILGAGRTARSIARVLGKRDVIRVGQVCNRSLESARDAVEFIGAGRPVDRFDAALSEGWLMVGPPDGSIEETMVFLAEQIPQRPQMAFHLSGSMPSSVLAPVGERIASVHPLRAFSDPAAAVAGFAGTWCVAEGEQGALAELRAVFERAQARWIEFQARDKAAWHAATVAASNFLVVIQALARRLALQAGMADEDAARLLTDLQSGTLALLKDKPVADVLTGPFERGDEVACRRLHDAVHQLPRRGDQELFDALARAAVRLAGEKRGSLESDRAVVELFAGLTSRSD